MQAMQPFGHSHASLSIVKVAIHGKPNIKGCGSGLKDQRQINMGAIDDDLAFMLEIHGDLAADIGLDLPQSPSRLFGVAHQHAGFKN